MDIIIVGAGIAGLGAGVALRHAGHKVIFSHSIGAAITIKPNASRVLASWDSVPEQSSMVALYGMSLIDGTNMQTLVRTYYKNCGGPGNPCEVRALSKVIDYDAENCKITTKDGDVLQADLVVAADASHSTAVKHVLDKGGVVQAGDTGWACMRWLVPTDELLSESETAHMIQDSATRSFTAAEGAAGLVWYPF